MGEQRPGDGCTHYIPDAQGLGAEINSQDCGLYHLSLVIFVQIAK